MAGPVDSRFERSVRRWLVGYPRRWRLARADEVIGTLAEMAPAGVTRLDLRSGLGLLVNGLVTRRRMLPPLKVRMRYRLGLGGVPWRYRGWLADEIASPLFQWRPLMFLALTQIAMLVWRTSVGGATSGEIVWWTLFVVLVFLMPRTRAQRDAAARHLVPRPGEPATPWDMWSMWVLRDRLTARWLVLLAAAALAVALVSGTVGAFAGARWTTPLSVCLGVGLVAALRIGVRAAVRLPGLPPQPARRLIVASRRHVAALCCWALMAVSVAIAPFSTSREITGSAPTVLGLSLLVLPSVAVGALLALRGPADLAAVDVTWLLFGRGPLRVDTLARGVVPTWAVPDPGSALGPAPATPTDPATA